MDGPEIILHDKGCEFKSMTLNGSCHDHHGTQTRSSSVTALVGYLNLKYGVNHKVCLAKY